MEGGLLCSGGGIIMCAGAVFPSCRSFSVRVWLFLRATLSVSGSFRKFSLVTLGQSVFILQSRHAWQFGHVLSRAVFRVLLQQAHVVLFCDPMYAWGGSACRLPSRGGKCVA